MKNNNDKFEFAKSNQTFLKNFNIKKILSILRKYESLSRIDLAAISSLDKKTITNIIKELIESKQVKVVSRYSEGAGRPKEMLALNGSYCYCIGVDLGGTHISGVVMDFKGTVICSNNTDLNNDMEPETLIKLCYYTVDNLLKKAGMSNKDIVGLGISIPGFVDRETGLSEISENLPKWFNIPLKSIFHVKYDTDIYVDDCSRLMALAELWYGEGVDCDDFLVMDLGLGIGCGIVINSQIFAGSTGKSGEVGHTIVEIDGPLCTCGKRGCIEALASGWALAKQAKEVLERDEKSILYEILANKNSIPTIKDLVLAADLGDLFCREILLRAGNYIGIGIANAISFFNPSKVIISGRLIRENELLLKKIEDTVKAQTIPQIYENTLITQSKLSYLASAIGAAILCIEGYY